MELLRCNAANQNTNQYTQVLTVLTAFQKLQLRLLCGCMVCYVLVDFHAVQTCKVWRVSRDFGVAACFVIP